MIYRQFGGNAFTTNDLKPEAEALRSDVTSGSGLTGNTFYSATYGNIDNPVGRRNEVWIEVTP